MAGKSAILSVRIISSAKTRAFANAERDAKKLERQLDRTKAKFAAFEAAALKVGAITAAATVATGAVGALGVGVLGVGALAGPALAPLLLGLEGIKQAAGAASGPFNDLKTAVSGVFAAQMVPGFEALGRTLTALQPALVGLAGTLSTVFNGVAAGIEANAGAISTVIDAAGVFITSMGPGLAQLGDGLLILATSAAGYAAQIGAGVGALLGSIGEAFQRLQAAGALNTIFANLGPILAGVGAVLGNVLFLFGQLGAAVAPVLGPILQTLGVIIASLTPPLTQIAQVAGVALLQALQALVPAILPLGMAFAQILTAVLPLVPTLAGLVATLATGLAPVLNAIAPILPALVVGIGGIVAVAKTARVVIMAWQAAQLLLNIALSANPIGIVVIAIAALVAGIIVAYQKCDWFRNAVNAIGDAFMWVVDKIKAVISWIGRIRWPSPPGWVSKLFDGGPAELFTVPPEALQMSARVVPVHNLDLAATTGPSVAGLGALGVGAAPAAGATTINNFTINGAIDPQATADQIRGILDNTARSRGAQAPATMGGRAS